jgi:hypothetical protein
MSKFFQGYEEMPLKASLIFVSTDDWEGIYINGELEYENHRLHSGDWIEIIRKFNGFREVKRFWADEEYMHDVGSYPTKFEDFPEGVLSEE